MTDLQIALAERDRIIQDLSESLKQSIDIRDQLHEQSEQLNSEVKQLRAVTSSSRSKWRLSGEQRLSQTTIDLVSGSEDEEMKAAIAGPSSDSIDEFKNRLSDDEAKLFSKIQVKFNDFLKTEIDNVKLDLMHEVQEKNEKESEINRLRQLLANVKSGSTEVLQLRLELDAIHKKEMEDLRLYFEQKCTDLEKQ